jgi:hypothetical protein
MASLNEIPKKNPFKVPENYFDEVNRKILSASSGNYPKSGGNSFIHRFRTQLAVAASVAGLILLSYAGLKIISNYRKTTQVFEIFSADANESILNDIDIQALEENVLSSGITVETSEFTSSEIIDYLLLENIEISDIYEKL